MDTAQNRYQMQSIYSHLLGIVQEKEPIVTGLILWDARKGDNLIQIEKSLIWHMSIYTRYIQERSNSRTSALCAKNADGEMSVWQRWNQLAISRL